jgi:hypothetical protein
MLIFSGVTAFEIEIGTLAVAITNGAADTDAAILAMTNTFMTGVTLHIDGGERLT